MLSRESILSNMYASFSFSPSLSLRIWRKFGCVSGSTSRTSFSSGGSVCSWDSCSISISYSDPSDPLLASLSVDLCSSFPDSLSWLLSVPSSMQMRPRFWHIVVCLGQEIRRWERLVGHLSCLAFFGQLVVILQVNGHLLMALHAPGQMLN